MQLGQRGNRSNFSSFDNPIFEDQATNFEEFEVIIEDINFSKDSSVPNSSGSELPIFEEPPKDQFISIASTSGTPATIQGLRTYQ